VEEVAATVIRRGRGRAPKNPGRSSKPDLLFSMPPEFSVGVTIIVDARLRGFICDSAVVVAVVSLLVTAALVVVAIPGLDVTTTDIDWLETATGVEELFN